MSHDIRTPMNAIIGLTHLAKSEDDLQTVRGYFHKIDSSSKFLLGLINDILDMSKIENGEMTLNEAPFSYGEFKESIQTLDAGMNAHIAKPIDVENLKKAIRSQLEKATA